MESMSEWPCPPPFVGAQDGEAGGWIERAAVHRNAVAGEAARADLEPALGGGRLVVEERFAPLAGVVEHDVLGVVNDGRPGAGFPGVGGTVE